MKETLNLVLMGNFESIVWEKSINSKLENIFKKEEMILEKSTLKEITFNLDKDNSVKELSKEVPMLSSKDRKKHFTIAKEKIELRIEEFDQKKIKEILNIYFGYLRELCLTFALEITRVGVAYGVLKKDTIMFNQEDYIKKQLISESLSNWTLAQSFIETIILNNQENVLNTNIVISKTGFFIDVNTVETSQNYEKEDLETIKIKSLEKIIAFNEKIS